MKSSYPVPYSITAAEAQFLVGSAVELSALPHDDFVARWSAIAYLQPGLHPDGYDCEGSGWPEDLKPYAAEAWRRCEHGELDDSVLYACDSQWAGLFDMMVTHTGEEHQFRMRIAAGGR
jgi:hypothetical protein